MKEFKPLKRLLRGKQKCTSINLSDIKSEAIIEKIDVFGGSSNVETLYFVIKTLDAQKIRHPRAIAQKLNSAGHVLPKERKFENNDVLELIALVNRVFRKK